jgi:hypothetical protein
MVKTRVFSDGNLQKMAVFSRFLLGDERIALRARGLLT